MGDNAWSTDELVRQLHFEIVHADRLLRHHEKLKNIGDLVHPASESDYELFRLRLGEISFSAKYSVSFDWDSGRMLEHKLNFSIDLHNGSSIEDVRKPLLG